MDVILQTSGNSYADEGLNYFISLYGFPPDFLGTRIPLKRVTAENPVTIDDHVHGWIVQKNAKIPVFQKPADLRNQGKELLTYTDGEVSYPCAVLGSDGIIISLDIFSHLGLILSGYMEKILRNHKEERNRIVAIPIADYYCDFLFSCIQLVQKTTKQPLVQKAFWPEGKNCAVCLTHDVDEVKKTYQWVTYSLKLIKQGNFGNLIPQCRSLIEKLKGHEPYWTFDEIIRIEGSRRVKSSFFFLKETGKVCLSDRRTWRHLGRRYDFNAPNVRKLLHELHSRGWEVGLHGSFYSYLDPAKLRSEKEALENSLGAAVIGGRQHNLNLKIFETWLNQERAGLSYDSTLGYNDCLGFRWGISFPFRPYYPKENRNLNILQIPLAIEDLPYFRHQQPWDKFLNVFSSVKQTHSVLTLLWHHSVFNENEFPGWGSDYAKILDHAQQQNAWIGSAKQIYEWWTHREKTIIDWEYDGTLLKISTCPREEQHFIKVYLPDSMKIKDMKNATVIKCDQESCEIKTDVLDNDGCIEITLTGI